MTIFQILNVLSLVLFSQTESSKFPVKPGQVWTGSQEKDTIKLVKKGVEIVLFGGRGGECGG